jgi:cell division protein FtsA
MVAQARASTVMGMLEEASLARIRGVKVGHNNGSIKNTLNRAKDWFIGNF